MIPKNKIRHFIGGQDFGEPRNWQDLVIQMDWLNKKESASINITDLEFVLEANAFLQERILNGISGGVGIFEGEPYTITVGNQQDPVYQFDGFLDFTDELTVIGEEEISAGLKQIQGTDWLNDVADSFSFRYLQDQNIINTADFVKVPYVINYVPDGTQLLLLGISIYLIQKELFEQLDSLADIVGIGTDAATPVVSVFPGWDVGNTIYAVLRGAARAVYIASIVVALVNLINEVFAQLLPKRREHLGMTFRRMMERGCQYLNLTFQSGIPELDWVHIPAKDRRGGSSGETGVPGTNSSINTFGDLIRTLKQIFNADFRISNGILRLERRDLFKTSGDYVIPAFFNDQPRLLDRNGFNTDEIVANYNINFQFDSQDQNTLDDQTGLVFQAITTPIRTINQNLVNIKGLTEIVVPFSLGKAKQGLNGVEEVLKALGKAVDFLTGVLPGRGTNFAGKIEKRIGSLLMSSDFISFGKVVAMNGALLVKDQRGTVNARRLWDNYHFINSFALVNGEHNQYFRYQGLRVPMSLEDFQKVLENNQCTDQDGNEAEIELVEYSPQLGSAVINYRIKKIYTNNLKIEYV